MALYDIYVSSDKNNMLNCGRWVWQLTRGWNSGDHIPGDEFMDLAGVLHTRKQIYSLFDDFKYKTLIVVS